MMKSPLTGKARPVASLLAQLGVVIAGFAGLVFAPPAQGRILLVPLTPYAMARLPVAVLGRRALLLGTGPFPGSLVVMARQRDLTWAMLRLGVLPVAASPAGCGSFAADNPVA